MPLPWSVPDDLREPVFEPDRSEELHSRVDQLEAEVRRLNVEVGRLRALLAEPPPSPSPSLSTSRGETVVTYVGPPPAYTQPSAPAPFEGATTCTEIVALPPSPQKRPLTLELQLGELPVAADGDVTEVVTIQAPPAHRRESRTDLFEPTRRAPRFTSQRLTLELKEIASLGWMRGIAAFFRRMVGDSVMPGELEELELAGVQCTSTWPRQILHGLLLGGAITCFAACVDLWVEQRLGVSFLVHDLMAHAATQANQVLALLP